MCSTVHVLSLTAVLITTVSVACGRHLQTNVGSNNFSSERRKMTDDISGRSLQDTDLTWPAHNAANQFAEQEKDNSQLYSSEHDDNSNLVRARMIPYDFSQEPQGPYVYVTTDTRNSTTFEGTTTTHRSEKPVATTGPLTKTTTISTDDPQTYTSTPSVPVSTVSSTTPQKKEIQTTPFKTTAETQTVTSPPQSNTTFFSTTLHIMNTTVSSVKPITHLTPLFPGISSTTKTTALAIMTVLHDPTTKASAHTTTTSHTTNTKFVPSITSSTLLIYNSTKTPTTDS